MEYEQYKAMQDIREIELRDSGLNTKTEICFKVQATALRPPLHTEGFPLCPHRTSHKGNLYRGICNYKVRSTQLLSPTQPALHKRQNTKPKLNHLYTRGMGTKPKQQSPLHKRDQVQSQTTTTITSTQGTKLKQRRDYNLVISKTTNSSW